MTINRALLQKTRFTKAVSTLDDLPQDRRSQIVFAGKSNVGKSSLINKLCQQNKLAKTAQKAGKTRQVVFFDVAGKFYLVDLPGYGFSAGSKKEQAEFSRLTDQYLHSGAPIKLILHILDARHLPTKQDLQMINWLESTGAPYAILLNKSDKLSKTQKEEMKKDIHEFLLKESGIDFYLLPVSAVNAEGMDEILKLIEEALA